MAFFIADNIISPLGFTTKENFKTIEKGRIGIDIINNPEIYPEPFPAAMIQFPQKLFLLSYTFL